MTAPTDRYVGPQRCQVCGHTTTVTLACDLLRPVGTSRRARTFLVGRTATLDALPQAFLRADVVTVTSERWHRLTTVTGTIEECSVLASPRHWARCEDCGAFIFPSAVLVACGRRVRVTRIEGNCLGWTEPVFDFAPSQLVAASRDPRRALDRAIRHWALAWLGD
ncbi:MAG: hypothetical protein KF901_03415 [Myxococcales bacterium]|nr:hypothetical protein [Myxococcales bacterium]